MKIAHVIDYFHTDVGYQEFYLARGMAEAGHDVRVITSTHRQHTVAVPGPDEQAGGDALAAAGVTVVRLPARQLGHDRAWIHGLETALEDFRPDVVHCHGPFAPTAVRTARQKQRLGYRLLVDNHIQEFIAPGASTRSGRAFYWGFEKAFGPLLRRHVDTWVAIGPHEGRFLRHRLDLALADVELVPLGFEPSIFRFDGERRAELRDRRGWGDETVVAVTGKIHGRKRPDLVAGACARVGAKQPVRLVVAGTIDDETRQAITLAAGELSGAGRLTVLPLLSVAELADLYLACDVVVFARLPSISIYEADGTGVRVLVGDDEFSRWLHAMHDAIEPVDPLSIDGYLVPVAGRVGRSAEAVATFSWPVITRRFLDLYTAAG